MPNTATPLKKKPLLKSLLPLMPKKNKTNGKSVHGAHGAIGASPTSPLPRSLDDIQATRRQSLRILVDRHQSMGRLGKALGLLGGAYISQLLSDTPERTISENTVHRWEDKLGLPRGWFDRRSEQELMHIQSPHAPIDEALLADAVMAVEECLKNAGVAISGERVASLVAMSYADAKKHASAAIDVERVRRVVELIKA